MNRYGRRWDWKHEYYLVRPSIPPGNVVTVWDRDAPCMYGMHLGTDSVSRGRIAQAVDQCMEAMLAKS